ncbi:hypothetical protein RRG08_043228 [Elysia crispata]|uniref:Uncharacterized protein n=1 Tax=Elysia crispata TaxID=231223 RepID=A0AAE0Y531_9GAST|nr:hypothetical protein RRG08_043228 [Elysia crispata]
MSCDTAYKLSLQSLPIVMFSLKRKMGSTAATEKLADGEKEEVQKFLDLGAPVRSIQNFVVSSIGKPIKVKDVHNLRQKANQTRTNGRSLEEQVCYPVVVFMVVDGDNVGHQCVGYACVKDERMVTLSVLFGEFVRRNEGVCVRTVIVDKDANPEVTRAAAVLSEAQKVFTPYACDQIMLQYNKLKDVWECSYDCRGQKVLLVRKSDGEVMEYFVWEGCPVSAVLLKRGLPCWQLCWLCMKVKVSDRKMAWDGEEVEVEDCLEYADEMTTIVGPHHEGHGEVAQGSKVFQLEKRPQVLIKLVRRETEDWS